jgi:hypothetical protein
MDAKNEKSVLRNAQRLLPQESIKKSGYIRIPGNFRHMDVDGSLPGLCVSTGPAGPANQQSMPSLQS